MPTRHPISRIAAPLALAPLLLAAIELAHPRPGPMLDFQPIHQWLAVHYAQIALFPLSALSVAALVRGDGGPIAWFARIALFTFAVCFVAFDTVAGVAVGVLAHASERAQDPAAWRAAIDTLWTHPVIGSAGDGRAPLLAGLGSCALAFGTLAAAGVLRAAGHGWAPVLLLAASGFGIALFNTHAWPGGPVTFGGIGLASAWLQWNAYRGAMGVRPVAQPAHDLRDHAGRHPSGHARPVGVRAAEPARRRRNQRPS